MRPQRLLPRITKRLAMISPKLTQRQKGEKAPEDGLMPNPLRHRSRNRVLLINIQFSLFLLRFDLFVQIQTFEIFLSIFTLLSQ